MVNALEKNGESGERMFFVVKLKVTFFFVYSRVTRLGNFSPIRLLFVGSSKK
jgi:hypothetical protein